MDDHTEALEPMTADPIPTQAHTCTTVVEELVADTAESAWDDVE